MNIRLGNKEFNITKKEIIILIVILFLIFITIFINSNKGKKLECNRTNSNITVNAEEKITAKFKNGNLSKLAFYYKTTPTADYQYMLDDMYDNFNNQLIALKNAGGYDYTINKGSNYVSYNSTVNINEIPDSSKEIIGYNNTWTYKDVKADLERNKFKCK